jgi:hypothetical protein
LLLSAPDQLVLNQTRLASPLGKLKLVLGLVILALLHPSLSTVMEKVRELAVVPRQPAGE